MNALDVLSRPPTWLREDLAVRTKVFSWVTERTGVLAVSRMSAADVVRARARRIPRHRVATRVFGTLPVSVAPTDRRIPGPAGELGVRVYRREGAGPDRPLVLNFHGGGGTLGNLDQSDWLCAHVAARTGFVVVSVDYRLAPEHPFPAGREDGEAALDWAVAHAAELGARSDRVAVMGDSAGGNLAAVLALRARDQGRALRAQLLFYPVVDLRFGATSHATFRDGPLLTRADMDVFRRNYLGVDGDPTDPYCSPLHHPEPAGVAPALVVTARIDPLHDEGVAYAEHLRAAGVPVRHRDHPRAVHGFLSFPGVCAAAGETLDDVCAELVERLTGTDPARTYM